MLVWVDIETSGLDPDRDYMLELGIVITDDNLVTLTKQANGDDLTAVFSGLVHPEDCRLSVLRDSMSEFVRDMHDANGLWAELESGRGNEADRVAESAIEFLKTFDALGQPMAGSSVHFDRGFIETDMPDLARVFGYRNIDVSTLKELASRWDCKPCPKGVAEHRAVADIRATINELDWYRKHFVR